MAVRKEEVEQVIVPCAEEMDDEDFLRHLDKRHRADTGVETSLIQHPDRAQSWLKLYRTYHDRLHNIKVFEDHEHEDEDDWDDEEDA